MPVFVHLTSHRDVAAIRRGGIRLVKGAGRLPKATLFARPERSHRRVERLKPERAKDA